jgi:hypothetical protein
MPDTPDEIPDIANMSAVATNAPAMPQLPSSIDTLVAQMVRLRDKIKAADDLHAARMKHAKDYKAQIEAALLDKLNQLGGESVKTAHGTVYRSTRRSATIADGDLFRNYVVQNNAFDLVDWRANATAIDDFIKVAQTPPPGVNFTTAYTVGVRRA